MSEPLHIEISALAAVQVRTAETWWGLNRPKAPGAIRVELERGSSLIALQPQIGARATNIALPGVRRLHLARIHYDPLPPRRSAPATGDSGLLACQPWKPSADLKSRTPDESRDSVAQTEGTPLPELTQAAGDPAAITDAARNHRS